MKKRMPFFVVILCAAVFSSTGTPRSGGLLAQTVKGGGEYAGTPKTIAHIFLEMEKPIVDSDEQGAYLDSLINKAVKSVPVRKGGTTEEAVVTLLAIDGLLKKEGFRFQKNYLLGRGLETKRIDCDNYSALYVAIAEVLRIPIIPVYAPGHTFVRFYFDDGSYLNWEPILGAPRQDSYYTKEMKIAPRSIEGGVYLKSLSRKEFLGVQYYNLGGWFVQNKKFRESIPFFSKSIELYPAFYSAYHNRGSVLSALNRPKEALEDLLKAAELDPARAETFNSLGDVYFDLKQMDNAMANYRESIKLDPGFYPPYHNIAALLQQLGRKEESAQWLKKANELKALQETKGR